MKIVSLLYHDVVGAGGVTSSGFVSPDANIYKLSVPEFKRHLDAIHARQKDANTGITVFEALDRGRGCLFTFDDGGITALTETTDLLDRFAYKGHFFITTDRINTAGFLSRPDIVRLAQMGHVIGTHSCSHPMVMSSLSRAQLLKEWRDSTAILSDILGQPVTMGSVPGGSYVKKVGETAAEAGIRTLFTSEPTASVATVDGCLLLGRYSVQRSTPAAMAAALGAGDRLPCLQQMLWWNFKKILKRTGGRAWIEFRKAVLARTAGDKESASVPRIE